MASREGSEARLAAGEHARGRPLLTLVEEPGARRVRGATGLYHFAILVPSRRDLARALHRLVASDQRFQGFADHGVSEAIYLADPDGNGIEIYRDRPSEEWPRDADGRIRMDTLPLAVDRLLAEAPPEQDRSGWGGLPEGTVMGHVHLHVADLAAAEAFYVGVLGMDLTTRYGASASFVAAGGYHHHVGLNTWNGVGAAPPPPGSVGLRLFEITLPSAGALDAAAERAVRAGWDVAATGGGYFLRDPSRNGIALAASPALGA